MSEHVTVTINGKPQHKRHGRKKPYTSKGIARLPCFRCGRPAYHQWQICSDGNIWRPLCIPCDVDLNRRVLEWANDPDAKAKIQAYEVQQYALIGALFHRELGWQRVAKILDSTRAKCFGVADGIERHLMRHTLYPDPRDLTRSSWTINPDPLRA